MSRKVAVVTGSTHGLGLLTARKLASRGFHVVLTCRNAETGAAACAGIRTAVRDARLDCLELDTSSLRSVRAFVDEFHRLALPLHLLVSNAGTMSPANRPRLSPEGIETTMATNAVGPFLLAHLLLADLKRAAPSRIVVVASSMHIAGVGRGPGPAFDWDDLDGEKRFHPVVAYRNSKLALMWFTYELSRRLEGTGVTVNAVCPGFVPETLVRHQPTAFGRFLFKYVLPRMPSSRSAEQGSDNTVFAATAPELEGLSGRFVMDCTERRSSDDSYDLGKARRWWDECSRLCGIGTSGEVEGAVEPRPDAASAGAT
jgi:NAD(P)-dependent dehydrogenase (short-subunit alcohol dehydrogenase family)